MVEVKADALERSFEQFDDDGVAALKVELETLKAKIAAGVIAAQRPALDGVKSAEASSFVDQISGAGSRLRWRRRRSVLRRTRSASMRCRRRSTASSIAR